MIQPIHSNIASGPRSAMRKTAFLLLSLVMTAVSAQSKPTTGYAPVNGVKMYYEVHGSGEPVVLLHGWRAQQVIDAVILVSKVASCCGLLSTTTR